MPYPQDEPGLFNHEASTTTIVSEAVHVLWFLLIPVAGTSRGLQEAEANVKWYLHVWLW